MKAKRHSSVAAMVVSRGPKRSASADSVVAGSIASSRFTLQQVAEHNTEQNCWMVVKSKVSGGQCVYHLTKS